MPRTLVKLIELFEYLTVPPPSVKNTTLYTTASSVVPLRYRTKCTTPADAPR